MEREYRREGTALCEDKRKELTKCKFRLAELELTFTRNIDNHEGKALFTRGELEGLPESYFTGRATKDIAGNTKFIVTTQSVDYFPLMNYAKLEATRRAMFLIQNTRCTDNLELLDEAVKLRLEMAKILGYNTHAEYALEPHMAKTPQAAYDMLAELRNNLTSLGRTELEELESLKRRDMEDVGRIYEGFNEWDRSFYTRMLHKNKHSIDDNKVKCYFSLATVIRGILEHYQTTFG
ncbi:metalloendopeptidase, partial [Coemansia sp. RSA 2618]